MSSSFEVSADTFVRKETEQADRPVTIALRVKKPVGMKKELPSALTG